MVPSNTGSLGAIEALWWRVSEAPAAKKKTERDYLFRGYAVALICDEWQAAPRCHWVVQLPGEVEVLGIGKTSSEADARLAAERCVDSLIAHRRMAS